MKDFFFFHIAPPRLIFIHYLVSYIAHGQPRYIHVTEKNYNTKKLTPTGVNLGIQINTLYQFVYLHKLPYNSGSSLSEVSFHSPLAGSSAMLMKGLREQ